MTLLGLETKVRLILDFDFEIDDLGRINIKSDDPLEILLLIANNLKKVDVYPETKKEGVASEQDNYNKFNVKHLFLLKLGHDQFFR